MPPLAGELKERPIAAFMVMGVQIYEPQPLFAVLEQDIILFSALIALVFSVLFIHHAPFYKILHAKNRGAIYIRDQTIKQTKCELGIMPLQRSQSMWHIKSVTNTNPMVWVLIATVHIIHT